MTIDGIVSNVYETAIQDQKTAVDADAFKSQLEAASASQDSESLKEACQAFESFFVNMMFKEMRKSIDDSGLTEKSFARSTFEGMLDEEMSNEIAASGGIGISDMLYKSLSRAYEINAASVDVETNAESTETETTEINESASASGFDLMG
jgi:flagellar protein FlgJ